MATHSKCKWIKYLSSHFIFSHQFYECLLPQLILYSNNLSSISEHLLEHWDEIEEIDIRNNPWKCACENQWMIDKLIPIIKEKSKNVPPLYEDLKYVFCIFLKSTISLKTHTCWHMIYTICNLLGVVHRLRWYQNRSMNYLQKVCT